MALRISYTYPNLSSILKKGAIICLIGFLISGCCVNKKETAFKIPEEKKQLVPFSQDTSLRYISQQNEYFRASAKQRRTSIIKDKPGPDSCDTWAFDVVSSSVFIYIFELNFEIQLSRGFVEDELRLSILQTWSDGNKQEFQIGNCEELTFVSADLFKDVEINGFSFNNVLVFKSCYSSSIDQLIYSAENGIEYVQFSDNRYLKLVKN